MEISLFTILKLIFSILSIVVFRYLIPYANLKLKDKKYTSLVDFIGKAIKAAESIYQSLSKSGDIKKAYVLDKAKEYVKKNHIQISDAQFDLLIQAIFTELDTVTINKKLL